MSQIPPDIPTTTTTDGDGNPEELNENSGGEVVEDLKDLIGEDNKNKFQILCRFCPSKILNPSVGIYVSGLEAKLPTMVQSKEVAQVESESITEWFLIQEMFSFENVGFSNQVEQTKYLACADCDTGPIGWHNIDNKYSYIALSRVRHE